MLKRFKKLIKHPKRGMSMVVVIISIAMLVVMGTLFTSIAMRSFNYSYSKLCKQQAYYTAEASVNALYDLIYDDEDAMNIIIETLDAKYEEAKLSGVTDITTVYCTIGEVGGTGSVVVGDTGPSIIEDAGLFKDVMGTCVLRARYNNDQRSQLSLEAAATYKGYSESVRMKIAKTTKAAQELAKIFSNAFCWSSPLTCFISAETIGNVYVAQPIVYAYDTNGEYVEGTTSNAGIYNTVLSSLENFGYYGSYTGTAGQYIRNANDEIINDNSHIGIYNRYLCSYVYANIETVIENVDGSTKTSEGNTKPFDIDNKPLQVEGKNLNNDNYYTTFAEIYTEDSNQNYYNDWIELYMFSDYRTNDNSYTDFRTENFSAAGESTAGTVSNSFPQSYLAGDIAYPRNYTAINGNLYVQSRALIGMWDKDRSDKENWQYYNDETYSREYVDYYNNFYNSNGGYGTRFEHGYPEGDDVFFDHVNNNIPAEETTFRLNGNLYLWEDTRIENFDSVNTYNAYQGIKNNIYARQDLVIDGFVYSYNSYGKDKTIVSKRSVSIFGDIMVQGDLTISNATIYGDVYCNGDSLTIIDSNIYGNVYFRGYDFKSDNVRITSGYLNFYDGNGLRLYCPGGNLVVAGLESDLVTETEEACSSYINTGSIGAHLKNTAVENLFYSRVNTKIVSAMDNDSVGGVSSVNDIYTVMKSGVNNVRSNYGNIFVEEFLDIDLTHTSFDYMTSSANSEVSLRDNIFTVTGTLVAQSLKVVQSQYKFNNKTMSLNTPTLNFNKVYVRAGVYLDGNNEKNNGGTFFNYKANNKSIVIQDGYGMLNLLSIWDTDIKHYETSISSLGTWIQQTMGINYSGSSIPEASEAIFAAQINQFATYGSSESNIRFAAGQELNKWADYFFPKDWEDKEVSTLKWSAPKAAENEASVLNVYYFDLTHYTSSMDLAQGVSGYLAATGRNDVVSIDTINKEIEIKKSMVFDIQVKVPAGYTLIFNTYEGNLHIKFNKGLEIGANAQVILTGGNMTFIYIEDGQPEGSDPVQALTFGDGCHIGIVEEMVGVEQRSDSIYFISYDNIKISLGYDMVLDGYVYAPNGFASVNGSSGNETLLNGCMAVKNYIMQGQVDNYTYTIDEYRLCVYNHVTPPLITDISFEYGGSEEDIGLFGEIVWEFLGYY